MQLEILNKFLYLSKGTAYFILKIASILSAFLAFGSIVYGFGFYLDNVQMTWMYRCYALLVLSFLVNYLLRFLYSFKRISFLKRTWFEVLLLSIVVANFFLEDIYDLESQRVFYKIHIVLYLILLSGYEVVKFSTRINLIKFRPTTMFLVSFLLLIGVGTILLMLPTATVGKNSMPFIDALFTSVSASCITGLSVVNTATYFSFKGQLILMMLFQLGGLGIISFATFFSTFFTKGVGIKHQTIVQGIYSTESLVSAQNLFKTIIIITLVLEFLFFLAIFFTWGGQVQFESLGQKIYYSAFYAVSAFCNAGFSLFPEGMCEPGIRSAYLLHIVIAVAVILGGLGFPVLEDIFNIHKMRERLKYPWKDWHLATKISIYTSVALVIFGTVSFYLLERTNVLKDLNFTEQLITSFFQSVASRTAGFSSVDLSAMSEATAMMLVFLMFIGASPASTGGGIKTSTFLIILMTAISTITEKEKVEIGRRTITQDIIFRAFAIFAFAVAYNFACIMILRISEPEFAFVDLVFEQVSAFGTVGFSRNITPSLSFVGKCMIMLSMFVGRVGLLTLAISLSKRAISTSYRYPNAHIMVG
jgi:trk system potassium uptake protein TrkH